MSTFFFRGVRLFAGKIIPSLGLATIYVIFSRFLSKEEYGLYQSIWVILSFGTVITCFGIPSTIISLSHRVIKSDFEYFKKQALKYSFLLSLAVYGFTIFYYQQITLLDRLLILPLLLSQAFYLIQESELIAQNKEKHLTTFNLLYSSLFLAAHLGILYTGFSLRYLILSITILSLLRSFLLSKVLISDRGKPMKPITLSEFKNQWLFTGLNDSVQILSKWIDKIILAGIMQASEFAVYFNGAIEIPFFNILLSAFQAILSSEVGKKSDENESSALELFKYSALLMSSLVFPIFFFLFFNRAELFMIVFGNNYIDSAKIFAITVCLLPIRIISFTGMLQIMQLGKKLIIGALLDLTIAFGLMWPLYTVLGAKGIALSMVIATYFQAGFYLLVITKKLDIPFIQGLPFKDLGIRFITNGVLLAVVYYLPVNMHEILRLVLGAVSMLILFLWNLNKQISLQQLFLFVLKKIGYKR